eukprot:12141244-Ditylum_brightwellii.AAC.1
MEESPPVDIKTSICELKGSNIVLTGSAATLHGTSPSKLNLADKCQTAEPDPNWAMAGIHVDDNGALIAAALKDRTAIAVSDGSYKNNRSAAACTIEGKEHIRLRIICMTTTPGDLDNHDAYR